MKKLIIDSACAFVSSLFWAVVCILIFELLRNVNIDFDFGGDKTAVFICLFVAMPLGNFYGIKIENKKEEAINKRALLITSIFIGVIGGFATLAIAINYNYKLAIIAPLIVSILITIIKNKILLTQK